MMLDCWGKQVRKKMSKTEKMKYAKKKAREEETHYVTQADMVKHDAEKCREYVRKERQRLGLE